MRQSPFFVLSIMLLLIAGCTTTKQKAAKAEITAKQVTVATVERLAAPGQATLVGTVTARNTADIETKVQSRVERIPVALGTLVRKGDLLAELDTREFGARVAQARAVYEQTSQDLKRFETLLSQGASTQQEFDMVKSRANVAEANLHEAEALLSYARIVAPFTGTVTRKMIDLGDLVVPGKPLFTIEEYGSPRFVVTISESRATSVSVGDSVQVSVGASNTVVKGRVSEISPSADPVSRSFEAKIDLPDSPDVHNGQFGRLLLPSAEEASLFIPAAALVRRGQLELVYVISPDNRAALHLVRTGRQVGDKIEILSGLQENERVVLSGQTVLTDGDPVEVQS